MLGLPKHTEIRKIIFKKIIYAKFKDEMTPAKKQELDRDIAKMTIVNEISAATLNLPPDDKNQKPIFVIAVQLKQPTCSPANLSLIAKLFNQRLVFALEYEDKTRLAIYRTKPILNEPKNTAEQQLELKGLNLDEIWQNIVIQIGSIKIEQGNTLDEQIEADTQKAKLLKQIAALEKKARQEKQPRRKFALREQIKQLKEAIK